MDKWVFLILIMAALLQVAGCASCKGPDAVVVNKVVSVPCIEKVPEKPDLASAVLSEEASLAEQIQAISIDVLKLKAYSNELRAIIEGCR